MNRFLLLLVIVSAHSFAVETVPIAKAIEKALEKSSLTSCVANGSSANHDDCQPFRIKVSVAEKDSPDSDFKADIDEFWAAPDKWSRQVSSPDFSQKIVKNGNQEYETHTGDYDPHWLREIEMAIFDPLPIRDQLERLNGQVRLDGNEHNESSLRWEEKIGTAEAPSTAFCGITFRGDGLLKGIYTPGYHATYDDFRSFGKKLVARKILFNPEPGTEIDASITTLERVSDTSAEIFAIPQSPPASEPIKTIRVNEATARKLIKNAPDIIWPAVRGGKTHGTLTMFISVDRAGKVRETEPMNSDNAQLDDSAREQVSRWEFKTAALGNTPVQIDSTLTFTFDTKIGNPTPQLSDAETRQQATHIVEAQVPPGTAPEGTKFTVVVAVDENGKILGVNNPDNLPTALFLAGYAAARQWQFRPYIHNGKPDSFDAHITFVVR